MKTIDLRKLAQLIRYYSLVTTAEVGSGHPTSSMSAADLMTVLWFGGVFRFDFDDPENLANDRLIFSKGHASPLYYSLFLAAGVIKPQEIMKLRKFDSPLEGHPTPRFRYTEAATGSLGQGLSVGVGQALGLRAHFHKSPRSPRENDSIELQPIVYVLLGDGEMAEGATWEAINLASYYKLDNLVTIVDVNRLGQSQETMLGWDTDAYKRRFEAFGWEAEVIEGHDFTQISEAYEEASSSQRLASSYQRSASSYGRPFAIIAKTIKGKGASSLENKEGWHGKPVSKDQLEKILEELGEVDLDIRGEVAKPAESVPVPNEGYLYNRSSAFEPPPIAYKKGEEVATRKAYGSALARLGKSYPQIVSLDAEVKNSTYAEIFKEKYPDRFFEMFIAEQNMVSAAVGFAKRGFIPFVSSFACFLTRGFDQIRMAALSEANVKFCGSHAGVSIGEDGPSQMGLEDLSMFRAVHGSTVLYPSDAVSAEKLVEEMIKARGIAYMRTTRPATQVIYENEEEFPVGGCKIHKFKIQNSKFKITNQKSKVVIVAAGVTLFESLRAQEDLAKEGIGVTVVDCYCLKPIDGKTLRELGQESGIVVTVEDHWPEGGLGDAVQDVFAAVAGVKVYKLAVTKMPRSGKPTELLEYEGISANAIVKKVKTI